MVRFWWQMLSLPKFLPVGKFFVKNAFQKYKVWGWKIPIWGKLRRKSKIKILMALYLDFVAFVRKLQLSASPQLFLTTTTSLGSKRAR